MSRAGPSRGWLYGPISLFIVLVAAYSAYWFIARGEIETGVDRWIDEQRALGVEIDYASKGVSGFPYRFALDVERPSYRDQRAGVDWQGEKLQLVMQPWNYRHAIARAPGRNEVDVSGIAGTALIDEKSAISFRWNADGITDVGLTLNAAELITGGSDISLNGVRTHYALTGNDARLSADWTGISLSPDLLAGQPIAFLGSTLRPGQLRVQFNGLAGSDPSGLDQERGIDLAQLRLDWGPLKLGAKGEFDITPAGHLNGPLKVRLDDVEALSTAIRDARLGRPEIALIVQGVGAASKDGQFFSVPIKEGALTFFGQRLTQFPAVAPPLARPDFPAQ